MTIWRVIVRSAIVKVLVTAAVHLSSELIHRVAVKLGDIEKREKEAGAGATPLAKLRIIIGGQE
jgi:hypothetical protein